MASRKMASILLVGKLLYILLNRMLTCQQFLLAGSKCGLSESCAGVSESTGIKKTQKTPGDISTCVC